MKKMIFGLLLSTGLLIGCDNNSTSSYHSEYYVKASASSTGVLYKDSFQIAYRIYNNAGLPSKVINKQCEVIYKISNPAISMGYGIIIDSSNNDKVIKAGEYIIGNIVKPNPVSPINYFSCSAEMVDVKGMSTRITFAGEFRNIDSFKLEK